MPKSEAPRKKAPTKTVPRPAQQVHTQVTSAEEWFAAAEGQILELPSGRKVRVRMPGMQAFIAADLIPNELMPIILGAINKHVPADDADLKAMQNDPAMLMKLTETMDAIFAYCVTEPKFVTPPVVEVEGVRKLDLAARQEGVLYTDMVDDLDKTYVFNVAVGGTRDLERFRDEQSAQLAALQTS